LCVKRRVDSQHTLKNAGRAREKMAVLRRPRAMFSNLYPTWTKIENKELPTIIQT